MTAALASPRPPVAVPWWNLSARVQAWWLARMPLADTWTLTQHNIYILPTRGGVVFAVLVVLLLLGSINYQLNLGYALTFLLAGSGLVSMQITHGVLRGLTLRLRQVNAVHAGEAAQLEVVMTNPGRAKHGVGLRYQERRSRQAKLGTHLKERRSSPNHVWSDVPAQGQASAKLTMVPPSRGWHPVPVLVIETRFPFGLFRAWSVWRPATQVLAYPRPEQPATPLPTVMATAGEAKQSRQGQSGEPDGVRVWRQGDSMRQVAWKKMARTGELVSRETAPMGARELWLEWHAASAGHLEDRLSRLTAWVLMAEHQGLAYGLRLPGRDLPLGQGDSQRRAALELLALWR